MQKQLRQSQKYPEAPHVNWQYVNKADENHNPIAIHNALHLSQQSGLRLKPVNYSLEKIGL